jgi:hypothetical protein
MSEISPNESGTQGIRVVQLYASVRQLVTQVTLGDAVTQRYV